MPRWISTRQPQHLAEDAARLFKEAFGRDPKGVWGAPGRVNVIGDHVDYAAGVSIPFALEQLTAVAAAPNEDGVYRVVSIAPDGTKMETTIPVDEVGPLHPADWSGYVVGTIWAANQSQVIPTVQGYNLAIVSDVPLGSGLSSSAALECATAVAAFELANHKAPTRNDLPGLVDACIRAENEVVGASTGGLDQRSSLYGEHGKALVIDFHEGTTTPVRFDLAAKGLALLIADTNAPHALNDGQYASRRGVIDAFTQAQPEATFRDIDDAVEKASAWVEENNLDVAEATKRVKHVVEETARTIEAAHALEADDMATFRQLMQDSHESLRDQYEVVTQELESAFHAAGEYGARMTGGGFGGSVIALVNAQDVEATAAKIEQAALDRGFPAPTFLVARPGDGARRLA